jgi:hypothetical protein
VKTAESTCDCVLRATSAAKGLTSLTSVKKNISMLMRIDYSEGSSRTLSNESEATLSSDSDATISAGEQDCPPAGAKVRQRARTRYVTPLSLTQHA